MLFSVVHSKLVFLSVVALVLGVGLVVLSAYTPSAPHVGRIGEYLIVAAISWGTVTSKKEV